MAECSLRTKLIACSKQYWLANESEIPKQDKSSSRIFAAFALRLLARRPCPRSRIRSHFGSFCYPPHSRTLLHPPLADGSRAHCPFWAAFPLLDRRISASNFSGLECNLSASFHTRTRYCSAPSPLFQTCTYRLLSPISVCWGPAQGSLM